MQNDYNSNYLFFLIYFADELNNECKYKTSHFKSNSVPFDVCFIWKQLKFMYTWFVAFVRERVVFYDTVT